MNNWRQILSWQERSFPMGSRVRLLQKWRELPKGIIGTLNHDFYENENEYALASVDFGERGSTWLIPCKLLKQVQ